MPDQTNQLASGNAVSLKASGVQARFDSNGATIGGVDKAPASVSGMYRAAGTVPTAQLAANLTSDTSLTVTGAAAGAVCAVAMAATIEAGLTWCAFVSAADTVKFRLANVTAGAITPAGSQAFSVLVINP